MTLVDDATSRTLGQLGEHETIWAAVAVLRGWIEQHGVPLALYTDWKNVYVRAPTPGEQATGVVPVTQFGRMCAALDIQIIAANSPQAKGRLERNHGTQQDRLVKKLRRLGLSAAEPANAFLAATHWADHNARFAVAPTSAEDFIAARRLAWPSMRSSRSKPHASSRTTGSCSITRGTSNSPAKARTRRHAVRSSCARMPPGRSRFGIETADSSGRRSPRRRRRRRPRAGPSPKRARPFGPARTIRGGATPARTSGRWSCVARRIGKDTCFQEGDIPIA